ncbi:hypothetical protein JCM5353_005513 [Sporobolomyces roseus]
MPKAPNTPLSCIFAINKPTGQPSMTLLNKLQPLFSTSALFKDQNQQPEAPQKGGKGSKGRRGKWRDERVKMGQGGTLDPLADGVLVIGTNQATKQLSQFLDCTKSYRAIALLGCSTDSYDSDGKVVKTSHWEGITEEMVKEKLSLFSGEIEQTPPVYSALKMDGKPLYEYARSNLPLPRPIPSRKVTISQIDLVSFTSGPERTDSYEYPKEHLDEKARLEIERLEKMVKEGRTVIPTEDEVVKNEVGESESTTEKEVESVESETTSGERPPIFEISLTVSSGTYIRSVIHDLGIALGSSAHVVKLTRTRQGQFSLSPSTTTSTSTSSSSEEVEESERGCVEWTMLEKEIERADKIKKGSQETKDEVEKERDAEGWLEWEREVLRLCKTV